MATVMVDVPYLSNYLSLPQPTLSSLTEKPTVDLAISLLQAVVTKAKEYDEVKAEKLRLDVELENALHSGEAKTRILKKNFSKAQKEAAELKEKLTREGGRKARSVPVIYD